MSKRTPLTRYSVTFVPSPLEPRIGIPLVFAIFFILAAVVISRSPQISDQDRAELHEALAANP